MFKIENIITKRVLSIILIMVLAISVFGCKENSIKNESENKSNDKESLAIFSYKPDTFCPIASNNEANLRMLGIVYDGLISLGDNYVPQPAIAESWQKSDDSLVWTITLRKNATWHDGSDCLARDVIYTINQIKKIENSPYLYNVSNIAEITETGKRSVKITLQKPSTNFVNLLYFPIIKEEAAEIDTANFKPNGTGAYKLEDRNEGNIYYLVRNDHWWGGKAKAETIEVRMLPGGDTALYAFGSGTIDMTPADNMDWGKFVDPTTAEYTDIATPIYNFLGINHKNPQLAMREIRRAISMVVDRDELIDEARMGYGVAANSPVRPEWFICENQKFDYKQNTNAAKKIMEENGWEFKDNLYRKTEDGVEYKATFSILINEDNTTRENVARMVSKNLEEFGMKINVVRVPYDEYTKRISEGDYDMFIGSMVLTPELDFSGLLGKENMFFFEDEEMEFVMTEMQNKNSDQEMKGAYAELINLFEQVNPVIGLFFENSVMIYSKQIEGDVIPSYFDAYRGIDSLEKGAGK